MVSAVVLPLTTAVLPTNPSAWVDCAVCCSDTSVASESLVLSCCWTPANSTSCWVNWLVSSGERVLVLQLGGQQLQEALEVAGDLLRRQRVGGRGRRAGR